MARLTSGIDHNFAAEPIGEERFLIWLDEMNGERARRGINERYQPIKRNGELSFEPHVPFKWKDRHSPSPTYGKPRLVYSMDREHEPA